MNPDRKEAINELAKLTHTKPRDPGESVFEDMEDVFQGEEYLGWIAPAKHGKKERGWWHFQPWGRAIHTTNGREAALKALQSARAIR